jgi:beta-glucosidase
MLKKTIATLLIVCSTLTQATSYWNWSHIDVTNISFPKTFSWGAAVSAREVEGNTTNDTFFEYAHHIRKNGERFVKTAIDNACDHWNRYKEDIDLIKQAGLTSFCCSIEWSKIEPTEGNFDEAALAHYADLCAYAHKNDINVTIVLKDYNDPQWFMKRGGFAVTKNSALFERYCLKICKALQGNVDKYITFWCPDSYAILGYWNDSHPPFKHDMQYVATVFKNELEAHVRVYHAIKKIDKNVQVGIAKQIHRLEPWYPWDKLACKLADKLTDEPFYHFFTTGTFNIKMSVPGKLHASVQHINTLAPQSVDFVGINYHTHGFIKNFRRVETNNPKEIPTDIQGFTLYPEGLYHAMREVSRRMAKQLNIPIYITQNCVATTNDTLRTLHTQRHLYAVSQAIKHGYNVQGYYYFSLLDGHSWGSYDKKFGLFAVDSTTMVRTLKPGAQYYLNVVNKFSA